MNGIDRLRDTLRQYDRHKLTPEATVEELRLSIGACGDLTERLRAAIRLLFPEDLTPGGRSILQRIADGDPGPDSPADDIGGRL